MTLFRLDASIRTEGSHSREIADIIEQEWLSAHPADAVVRRDVGREPVPANAWAAAVEARWMPEDEQTALHREAVGMAAADVDALLGADALLFGVPLYNWGVSQHFKAWVDLTMTDARMGGGATPLADKPAILVVVRGGGYGPGTPKEGWDHATAWMRRILNDVWRLDLRVVEAELTLVGTNPALAGLEDLAAASRRAAADAARAYGSTLDSRSAERTAYAGNTSHA